MLIHSTVSILDIHVDALSALPTFQSRRTHDGHALPAVSWGCSRIRVSQHVCTGSALTSAALLGWQISRNTEHGTRRVGRGIWPASSRADFHVTGEVGHVLPRVDGFMRRGVI
jgi:hypothetical protein